MLVGNDYVLARLHPVAYRHAARRMPGSLQSTNHRPLAVIVDCTATSCINPSIGYLFAVPYARQVQL